MSPKPKKNRTIRADYVTAVADSIRSDCVKLGLSEREVAEMLGISNSTFNNFLNNIASKPQRKTIEKITSASCWSDYTNECIRDLKTFMPSLKAGAITADGKKGTIFRISSSGTLINQDDQWRISEHETFSADEIAYLTFENGKRISNKKT